MNGGEAEAVQIFFKDEGQNSIIGSISFGGRMLSDLEGKERECWITLFDDPEDDDYDGDFKEDDQEFPRIKIYLNSGG